MENTRKFIYNLILITFGSFLFIGILENYKSDENIKIKILEEYFKPARASMNRCITEHNNYINTYSDYVGSFNYLFIAMEKIHNNPKILRNSDYLMWFKAILENYSENNKKIKDLPEKVNACHTDSFLKMETLAISTGMYDEYSTILESKVNKLNDLATKHSKNAKKVLGDFKEEDLLKILDNLLKSNFKSKKDIEELLSKKEIMNSTHLLKVKYEQNRYKTYQDLFSNIREKSATKINELFKTSFFDWLFKLM